MPSIVPKNPAPIPAALATGAPTGATSALGAPPRPGSYWQTDWTRLAGPGGLTQYPGGKRAAGGQATWDWRWNAIPPGFSQASMPSSYGPWWRGAAFGPSGRLSAPMPGGAPNPWAGKGPGVGGEAPGMGTVNPQPAGPVSMPGWPTTTYAPPKTGVTAPTEEGVARTGGLGVSVPGSVFGPTYQTAVWPPKTKTYPTPKW